MAGQPNGEFKRFRDLTKQIAAVPKREAEELKATRARKKRAKRTAAG